MGSEKRLEFDVQVFNYGEDAFESMFYLTVPPGLNYINIERIDYDGAVAVLCSAPTLDSNNTLRCDIGNPLPASTLVSINLYRHNKFPPSSLIMKIMRSKHQQHILYTIKNY
jgi:hypothetical protein